LRSAKFLLSSLALLGFLIWGTIARAVEVNPDLDRFEHTLESTVQQKLDTLFGADSRIVVTIAAKQKLTPTAAPQVVDLSYVDVPMDALGQANSEIGKNLKIDSVDAELQVPAALDQAIVEQAQEVVKRILHNLNPKVNVTRVENVKKAQDKQDKSDKPDPGDWLSFAALLGGALILTFGIILLGRAIKYFSRQVLEGFQSMRDSSKSVLDGGLDLGEKPSENKNSDKTSDTAGAPAILQTMKDYSRNLKIVAQILRESPMVFSKAIQDNEREWRGVKWITPSLSAEDQDLLRRNLGSTRIAQMMELSKTEVHEDRTQWLQEFAERLVVQRMQGGSFLQKALSAEVLLPLFLADRALLREAAAKSGSRAAWRILAEFLPESDFEPLLCKLNETEMETVLSAAEVTEDEVRGVAQELLKSVQTQGDQNKLSHQKREFYRATLLNPMVMNVMGKAIGEDDLFLDGLSKSAPELVTLIRERVWTARDLNRVPKPYLEKIFKSLPLDHKSAVIFSLPGDVGSMLEVMLPEGNVKTIVLDQLKKCRERNSADELKAKSTICRQFLDYLRMQAQEKKFELLAASDHGAVQSETSAEVPDNVIKFAS
jgi:hypothetical protein